MPQLPERQLRLPHHLQHAQLQPIQAHRLYGTCDCHRCALMWLISSAHRDFCIYLVVLLPPLQKDMQKPMQTPPPHFPMSGGYMSPGTPPSMYLGGGAPPYGTSLYGGPALPRYGIAQFPGGSGYPYGYGGRLPMGSPYGPPMHMAGPPYSAGSMMGPGRGATTI